MHKAADAGSGLSLVMSKASNPAKLKLGCPTAPARRKHADRELRGRRTIVSAERHSITEGIVILRGKRPARKRLEDPDGIAVAGIHAPDRPKKLPAGYDPRYAVRTLPVLE
jgi:hypothetical protein